MDIHKRYAIKRMLNSTGSAATGIRMMFEQGKDPIVRQIAQNPDLMMKIFDDLVDRLAPLYEGMAEDEIDAVTAFYSTKAGKSFNVATKSSVPKIEGIVVGWQQDVLAHLGGKKPSA
jgi:hypothetical protein